MAGLADRAASAVAGWINRTLVPVVRDGAPAARPAVWLAMAALIFAFLFGVPPWRWASEWKKAQERENFRR